MIIGEFGLVYKSYLTGWQGRTTAEIVAVKTLKSKKNACMADNLISAKNIRLGSL